MDDRDVAAFSISEFCRRNGISQSFYFKLQQRHLAPRTMNLGHRRLITPEAEKDWQREREAASDSELRETA
jgi:hypothetical protein